jgi:hypothetical protein
VPGETSACRFWIGFAFAAAWLPAAECALAQANRPWVDPPERYENSAPTPAVPPKPEPDASSPPGGSAAPQTAPSEEGRAADPQPPRTASPERVLPPPPVLPEARSPPPERSPPVERPQAERPRERQDIEPSDRVETVDTAAVAEDFATEYLRYWSAPNAATLDAMQAFYAPEVLYHGRRMTMRGLLDEKRRFIQRWPVRNYATRPETMRTSCDRSGSACMVRTAFDFRAASPQTGKLSQGSAILLLEISFATGRPLIVVENSQVTSRLQGTRREAPEDVDEP